MKPIDLIYNDACRDYFKQKRIYFTLNKNERIKPNQKLVLGYGSVIEPYAGIKTGYYLCSIGAFTYSSSTLAPRIATIGRYTSIASGMTILGSRHPYERISTSLFTYDATYNIYKDYLIDMNTRFRSVPRTDDPGYSVFGHDVWIGQNVTLAPGVDLGTGCVVGANALVTKDVPPYAIVGGVPAKVIKYRFSEPVIERLLASEWWQYGFDVFGENQAFMDPIKVLDLLDRKRDEGTLHPFTPEPLIADDGLLHRIYGDDIPPQLQPR